MYLGFFISYIAPLMFVLCVTMLKEAYDDLSRMRRDKELNSTKFEVLFPGGFKTCYSMDLKVG